LLAEALNARGMAHDHLGQGEQGLPDFQRAMLLAPDADDIALAASVNAILLRQFDRAIELANHVLGRQPGNLEALDSRARAHFFKGELDAARADLSQSLKDPEAVRRGYPVLLLSLAMRQQGLNPAALKADFAADQLPAGWPRPLIDHAFGLVDAEAVLRAAKAEKQPNESLCEAYYYLGEAYRAMGDTGRANEAFRKAVDQNVLEFVEDSAARFRLANNTAR